MVAAEKWGHNMEVQEVNILEVLVPMRNLRDCPNYGCMHYYMVNSSTEVLGYLGWIPKATEGSQGLFLTLGRMTYSHFPNRIFI